MIGENKMNNRKHICDVCENYICKDMHPTMQPIYIKKCIELHWGLYVTPKGETNENKVSKNV